MSENKKLNVYMHIAENSGVGYYREYLPAIALRELGLANVHINDFRWGEGDHVEITEKVFYEQCNWADIVIAGRLDRPEYYAKWGAVREYFNVPIILDTDDNVHNVRPTNPGYQGYHPGSEAQIWNYYAMTRVFDAITVTTKHLQSYYIKYHPRIYILPNSLDVPEWDKFEKIKHGDIIRIAFICSASHADGFNIIIKPVYDILQKYKNVEFWYPDMYWRLFHNAPKDIKDQLKSYNWIKLKDWQKGVKDLGIDIGLAPLADNLFNRSKSNLRYIEYGASRTACIVSSVEPYALVQHGITGLVAREQNEWYTNIENLILDEKLRDRLAENAYNEVNEKYNIWNNAKMWLAIYIEVYQKFHSFYGEKKLFHQEGKNKYREVMGNKEKYRRFNEIKE